MGVQAVKMNLPWPDKHLSPNGRHHWAVRNEYRERAIMAGYTAAIGWTLPGGAVQARLIIHPPDGRRRDIDNIFASLKPTIDGVFIALQDDDSIVKRWVLEMAQPIDGGLIELEILPLANELQ